MDLKKTKPVPWNDDTTYALGLFRIYAKILGIWPLDRDMVFPTMMLTLFISVQSSIILIYTTNLIRVGYCGRAIDLVEVITMITISSVSFLKILRPWRNLDKMYFIINSAIEDWAKVYDKKSHEIMMGYAYKGRAVYLIQLVVSSILIFRTILLKLPKTVEVFSASDNITGNLRIVPYGPACWVSTTMSVHYYHAYYSLICIHWLLVGVAYVGSDVYIFGLGMHMCGQFELLYSQIEEIRDNQDYQELRSKLVDFINRHSHLLNVAHTFEKVFSNIIVIEVIANTFIISISGNIAFSVSAHYQNDIFKISFNILDIFPAGIVLLWAIKIHSRAIAIPKIIRIYLFYMEIFMVSYVGEGLSNQTERLRVAVYNFPWYKMPPSIMKDILFIMMRINYPFYLTAGKIGNMNFENFKSIIKSTFSYFSILRLMFQEE